MTGSRFTLLDKKYLLLDNKLKIVVDPDYAGPFVDMLRFVEKQLNIGAAIQWAELMKKKLPGKVSAPDDATALIFATKAKTESLQASLGPLVFCGDCKRKYRTLNRPDAKCPICHPPESAAVLPIKQGE